MWENVRHIGCVCGVMLNKQNFFAEILKLSNKPIKVSNKTFQEVENFWD